MEAILKNALKFFYKRKGIEFDFIKRKILDGNFQQSIVIPYATYAPWLEDNDFKSIYNLVKNNTLVDIYKCYELWQLSIEQSKLEGDYIEIGVWRGGSGALIAQAANKYSDKSSIFLCDTFKGIVKAGEFDNLYKGGELSNTSKQVVSDLIDRIKLKNVNILEGIFPDDTGDMVKDRKFKLCHIDVDVFEGAKQITEWIWDRLVIGGIIIYDDFGFSSTQGVTKYVESQRNMPDRLVVYNLNGHGIIIKTK